MGVDGVNQSPATSRLSIALKPLDERDARAPAIARRIAARAAALPGVRLYLQPVQDLTIEDRVARSQYQFTIEALSRAQLEAWTPKLTAALQRRPELDTVTSDHLPPGRMAWVEINRDAAGRLGINMDDVDNALYDALGQRLISTIFTQTNQYKVVLETEEHFRRTPQDLEHIYVTGGDGKPVPLTSIAKVEERPVQLALARQGQFPVATLSFNVAQGSSLGAAVRAVQEEERELRLPAALRTQFQGAASAFLSSTDNQLWLILAAVVTVYIVLGVLYESYIHPLTILSTLPSAGIGALLALMLAGMELGVVGIIGIILLIGIVKKKRHYDDRLRPGGRTTRGQNAPGGHPAGLSAAAAAHSHDHVGGPAGGPAPHAGLGHGRGTAPSPGREHGGRAAGKPGADPLHHARGLPLV